MFILVPISVGLLKPQPRQNRILASIHSFGHMSKNNNNNNTASNWHIVYTAIMVSELRNIYASFSDFNLSEVVATAQNQFRSFLCSSSPSLVCGLFTFRARYSERLVFFFKRNSI